MIFRQVVVLISLFLVLVLQTSPVHSQLIDSTSGNEKYNTGIQNLRIYNQKIKLYRAKNGAYPPTIGALITDMRRDPKHYGFNSDDMVIAQMVNSDYARVTGKKNASITLSSVYRKRNPDGTVLSAPKVIGSNNLIAYTEIYTDVAEMIMEEKPTFFIYGDYLALYDDGFIEVVPPDCSYKYEYGNKMNDFVVCFPHESHLPFGILTFEEFCHHMLSINEPIYVGSKNDTTSFTQDDGAHESLVIISRLLSYPNRYGIDREKLWRTFSLAQEEFTLQETQTGAQKLGLSLQLRTLSLQEIEQLNAPALFLTTDDKRIVTLANLDDNEAIVIDRGLTRVVSRETLAEKYGGEALVPQAAQTPSAVAVTDPVRVLDFSSTNAEAKQQVTITNRGKERLTLQIERPIPGVTSAELSSDSLAPGASATLSLTIKWRDILKGDSQNVFVFLKTNDPVRPRLQLGFKLQQQGAKTS